VVFRQRVERKSREIGMTIFCVTRRGRIREKIKRNGNSKNEEKEKKMGRARLKGRGLLVD